MHIRGYKVDLSKLSTWLTPFQAASESKGHNLSGQHEVVLCATLHVFSLGDLAILPSLRMDMPAVHVGETMGR